MNIKGLTAIVTGGGSGMGAETARVLAGAGAKLALWDMNESAAKAVAKEIGGLAVSVDVTGPASVAQALEQTKAELGDPRVLVNCAGILIGQRVAGKEGPADLEHFQKVIGVNLVGTFNVLRLVAAHMTTLEPLDDDGSRGVVINAASIAAFEGQIGQAAYSASKGGVVAMTLPIARELGKFGVRIMAIAPGAVETPMMEKVPDNYRETIEAGIPFPSRFAKADEFARLALHIVENNMLNGSVIRLDGAARLAAK